MLVCRGDRFGGLTREAAERLFANGRRVSGFIMAHSHDGVGLSGSLVVEIRGEIFLSDELARSFGPLDRNDLFQVEMWLEGKTLCLGVTATNHFPDAANPRRGTLSLKE